jgi:hypothetical protein
LTNNVFQVVYFEPSRYDDFSEDYLNDSKYIQPIESTEDDTITLFQVLKQIDPQQFDGQIQTCSQSSLTYYFNHANLPSDADTYSETDYVPAYYTETEENQNVQVESGFEVSDLPVTEWQGDDQHVMEHNNWISKEETGDETIVDEAVGEEESWNKEMNIMMNKKIPKRRKKVHLLKRRIKKPMSSRSSV